MATDQVNGKRQNWTSRRSKISQPIDKKFETGNYVCAKFRANPFIGGLSAKGRNITDVFFYFDISFLTVYRIDRSADFYAQWFKRHGLT